MSRKIRKPMTLQDHYETSTALREAEEAVRKLLAHNRWFYSEEVRKLSNALTYIAEIKNRLDNELLADKALDEKWGFLYYGEQSEADKLIASVGR